MHRILLGAVAAAGLLLGAHAPAAHAQGKAVELEAGVLGIQNVSCSGCSGVFTITTGGAYFGAGFYINAGMAFEPTITAAYASTSGSSSTILGLGVGFPIYFDKSWGRKGWFFTPRVTWTSYSCTDCTSETQFGLGAAIGGKVPLNDNAALKIQGTYDYGFASGDVVSTSTIGGSIGLSVFIK